MRMLLPFALALVAGCAAPPAGAPPGEGAAKDPWDVSARAGYAFRGVGQEPGWTVEVAPGREIRAVLDYGARTIVAPAAAPVREGTRVEHRGNAAGGEVRVAVEAAPCSDAMSGERMTHRVTLWLEGRTLHGCGSPLPLDREGRVDGWWRLEALDGRPVAVGGEAPYLRIERAAGRASGSTGCNGFGGEVTVEGERIAFGALAMTRRACVDEALNDRERRFAAALEGADRYALVEGVLVLMRGGAELARFTPWEGPPPRA